MADFLARLSQRTLGEMPAVWPATPSMFAPAPGEQPLLEVEDVGTAAEADSRRMMGSDRRPPLPEPRTTSTPAGVRTPSPLAEQATSRTEALGDRLTTGPATQHEATTPDAPHQEIIETQTLPAADAGQPDRTTSRPAARRRRTDPPDSFVEHDPAVVRLGAIRQQPHPANLAQIERDEARSVGPADASDMEAQAAYVPADVPALAPRVFGGRRTSELAAAVEAGLDTTREPRVTAPAHPVIRVTIGRIDVRAAETPQPKPRASARPPALSLESYLKQQDRRQR
jgi:hypothetical protein